MIENKYNRNSGEYRNTDWGILVELPTTCATETQQDLIPTVESTQLTDSREGKMDNNDWAKQYIESVDRNISEIRKESNENRREIKEDIRSYVKDTHDYINVLVKKTDDYLEETRVSRQEIKDEIRDIKKDNTDTRKWILGVGISVIVALVALGVTIILSLPK